MTGDFDTREKFKEQPFRDDDDYLEYLYVYLDLLLMPDSTDRTDAADLSSEYDAAGWGSLIEERLIRSTEAGVVPALEQVMMRAGLPAAMRGAMAYLLRIALDPGYERAASAEFWKDSLSLTDFLRINLSRDKRLFREGNPESELFDLLDAAAPGLTLLFPQLYGKDMIGNLTPVMDRRLVRLCMGRAERNGLPCGMYYLGADTDKSPYEDDLSAFGLRERTQTSAEENSSGRVRPYEDTVRRLTEVREKLAAGLVRRAGFMPPEVVVLWGQQGSGKKSVLRRVAEMSGCRAVVLPLHSDSSEEDSREYPVYPDAALLLRECLLTESIPVIEGLDRISRKKAVMLAEELKNSSAGRFAAVYLLTEAQEIPDYLPDVFCLEMPSLRTVDRICLWKAALAEAGVPDEKLEALANTFPLTPGQIRRCADQARRVAGPDRMITEDILYQVCYALLGHPLKNYSMRVKSNFTWEDLKMAPMDKVVLRDLCMSVRNCHIVMQEWEFEHKVPYGAGITALFSGPPGTGKTMAAQVIANDLHMELYKIDVSQLIDKYVGETEKNIRRVFEQAGKSNSVLFFDEADAIFNKRLEAKNSNERFANIESSLLLQCIEEYDGVAILATNNMAAIDAAFIRRFRFYLVFKEPNEKIRSEIWESVFPKQAPVAEEVDYRELAHIFNFNGAAIKNVALSAAYLAARKKKPIGLLEILVAVRREMEKNQRVLAREDLGRLGYLFQDVLKWGQEA